MGEKESYKKSMIIITSVASVLVVAGIIAIVIIVSYSNKKEKYYETIKKAETYMTDMRYEEAIAQYEKALAVLYEQTGDIDKAKSVATEGYRKTRNTLLSNMVTNITAYGISGYEFSSNMQLVIRDPENLKNKAGNSIKFKYAVPPDVRVNNLIIL